MKHSLPLHTELPARVSSTSTYALWRMTFEGRVLFALPSKLSAGADGPTKWIMPWKKAGGIEGLPNVAKGAVIPVLGEKRFPFPGDLPEPTRHMIQVPNGHIDFRVYEWEFRRYPDIKTLRTGGGTQYEEVRFLEPRSKAPCVDLPLATGIAELLEVLYKLP